MSGDERKGYIAGRTIKVRTALPAGVLRVDRRKVPKTSNAYLRRVPVAFFFRLHDEEVFPRPSRIGFRYLRPPFAFVVSGATDGVLVRLRVRER